MKLPAKTLWQLLIPSEKAGHAPADVFFLSSGAAALAAFAKSPEGSVLQPVQMRLAGESKGLALTGKSHLLTVSPVAITSLIQPAKDDDPDDVRFQKIGEAIDKFVSGLGVRDA